MFLINALMTLMLADFTTGLFHWLEDSYEIPFKSVLCQNRNHHENPSHILTKPLFKNIDTTLMFTVPAMILNYHFYSSWWVFLYLILLSITNWVHRVAHTKSKHQIITILQSFGILQSQQHHHLHHINTITCYCILTNYLNPILDHFHFWRSLEALIDSVFNIKARIKSDEEILKQCKEENIDLN